MLGKPQKREDVMSKGLDVIIVDDEEEVCEVTARLVNTYYVWGEVYVFSNMNEAVEYCLLREGEIAVFVVDVFLGNSTGFMFIDAIAEKYPSVYEDSIIITGDANDEVVNTCVASGINHLLEKPVRPYALQLAIRSIVSKYLSFSRKLLNEPGFADMVAELDKE